MCRAMEEMRTEAAEKASIEERAEMKKRMRQCGIDENEIQRILYGNSAKMRAVKNMQDNE